MKVKSSMFTYLISILKNEIQANKGANKFLLLAIFTNIPSPLIFIPYVTQAMTLILLGLFLKYYPKLNTNHVIFGIPKAICIPVLPLLLLQIFWFPYLSQLISIVLLVGLYILSKNN